MNNLILDHCFCLNEIVVEPGLNRISCSGEHHKITAREMDVLLMLARNGDRMVTRDTLFEEVWRESVVNDEALTLIISRLRKALGDNPRSPQIIETIPKKGYRLMVSPKHCLENRTTQSRFILKKPAFWISFLAFLLFVFASLFFRVRTEYEKISQPPVESQTEAHATELP